MKATSDEQSDPAPPPPDVHTGETDLKFVAVNLGERMAGGWYRELPDAQIEVLSRAQLERVQLTEADAETTAREKITEIVTRHSQPSVERAESDTHTPLS
jgi:hypothetical protein